ncbi:MAG TPA: hypothetical protein DEQ38_01200 [Elusimicrobia bacterium]|nr:MAG: hypothetical protein A2089_14740 [Elusimicrobia bacterium GWD2_63_28]HCC46727.1 hypothetical protein [Elusimicrobiota bacterium]
MKGTRANEKLYWDSRAGRYPRPFAGETAAKTRRILRLLAGLGVTFAGQRLLDVGCGTGVYALPLAGVARRVLGVDSSPSMLGVFRSERRARGIRNAACLAARWDQVPATKIRDKFDIALASMTAAVRTRADFRRMEAAAPRCVYIGWAGVRRNALLEKVYAAHGLEYKAPEGAELAQKILTALGREYKIRYLRDSWTRAAGIEETLAELEVSMKVNGAAFRRDWAEKFLRRRLRGGLIRQTTRVRKAIIAWSPLPASG